MPSEYKYYFLSGTQEVRYDLGSTALKAPRGVRTGSRHSLAITYIAGKRPVRTGGAVRFAIPLPFSPPQADKPSAEGHVTAAASRKDVRLSISINNSPFTGFDAKDGHCGAYARSVFVRIEGGRLEKGDSITLHYNRAKAAAWSGWFDFSVFVDPDGTRKAKNSGYYIVADYPRLFVAARKADHFLVYLDSNLTRRTAVQAVARDKNDDFDRTFRGKAVLKPAGKPLSFKGGLAKAAVSAGGGGVLRVSVGRNLSNPSVAAGGGRNVYWGDLHTHSLVYDGIGTPTEVYAHGRDVTRLDFQCVSEHSFFDPSMWPHLLAATRRFHQPGRFITFAGYESRTAEFGDINFYFPGERGVQPPPTKFNGTYNKYPFAKYIRGLAGVEVLVVPHCHLKPSAYYPPAFQKARMRLMEIYSQWGNFEKPGRPFTLSGKMTVEPQQSAIFCLNRGMRFGFCAGSDNHSAHPGYGRHMRAEETFHGGLTAVYAPSLTRKDVYGALTARRCFATTGCRMLIDFSAGGVEMGGQAAAAPARRRVCAAVHGQGPLKRLVVVRNGREVKSVPCGGRLDFELDWTDSADLGGLWLAKTPYSLGRFMYYYLRVEQSDSQIGWASPVWFDAPRTGR